MRPAVYPTVLAAVLQAGREHGRRQFGAVEAALPLHRPLAAEHSVGVVGGGDHVAL